MTIQTQFISADGKAYASLKAAHAGIRRSFVTSDGVLFQNKSDALAHEALEGRKHLALQILHEHFSDLGDKYRKQIVTQFFNQVWAGDTRTNLAVIRDVIDLLLSDVPTELREDTEEGTDG